LAFCCRHSHQTVTSILTGNTLRSDRYICNDASKNDQKILIKREAKYYKIGLQKSNRGKKAMKRVFTWLCLILLFLTACTGKQPTNTNTDAGAAGEKNLVVDLVAEPVSTDPQQVTDINSMRILQSLYDRLVGWDSSGFKMVPKLAESWDISPDEKEYTFKLRKGVKFNDGTDFDANAVKYTFDRMLDEKHPEFHTGPFPFAKFYFGEIDKVEALDANTVKFTLKRPFAPFLNNLTSITGSIVSPAAVKKFGKDFALNGVGSGPFALESWQKGIQLKVKANKDHWDGAPKVDSVVFQPVVEDLIRVTKLQTGEADIIVDVNPDSIAALEKDSNYKVIQQTGPHVWWVGLNMNKKPFDNVKVRQAVNYAVNKEAIVTDILKGTGNVSTQPLSEVLLGFNKDVKGYPYDKEKAKQLLTEAGYPNGFTVNFLVPESGSGMQSPVPMSTAIQGYLKDIGITVTINKMEWGTFLGEVGQGAREAFDMWAMSWMSGTGDPDLSLYNLLHSDSFPPGFNTGYYKNTKVDELVTKARGISDVKAREPLYFEASKLISEDAPWIFIDHAKQTAAFSTKVKGFDLHPSHVFDLNQVTKE
jgi:peptide/nickel transport system substrate-binding protein